LFVSGDELLPVGLKVADRRVELQDSDLH
jgi:hypothetical protein